MTTVSASDACRRGALAGIVAIILLTLTACESVFFEDPIAVRANNGELEVVVCTAVSAGQVIMEEWAPGGESATFWTSDRRVRLQPGALGTSADQFAAFGDAPLLQRPQLEGGSSLLIGFYPKRGSTGRSTSAEFDIPDSGLPEDGWLQTDGAVTNAPCPQDDAVSSGAVMRVSYDD